MEKEDQYKIPKHVDHKWINEKINGKPTMKERTIFLGDSMIKNLNPSRRVVHFRKLS